MNTNKTTAHSQTPHFVSCDWWEGYDALTVVVERERKWIAAIEASNQLTDQLKDLVVTEAKQSVGQLASFLDRLEAEGVATVELAANELYSESAQWFIVHWVRSHSLTCDRLNRLLIAADVTDVTFHPATI